MIDEVNPPILPQVHNLPSTQRQGSESEKLSDPSALTASVGEKSLVRNRVEVHPEAHSSQISKIFFLSCLSLSFLLDLYFSATQNPPSYTEWPKTYCIGSDGQPTSAANKPHSAWHLMPHVVFALCCGFLELPASSYDLFQGNCASSHLVAHVSRGPREIRHVPRWGHASSSPLFGLPLVCSHISSAPYSCSLRSLCHQLLPRFFVDVVRKWNRWSINDTLARNLLRVRVWWRA